MAVNLQGIGEMLQGVGAGFSGNLPQYQQARALQEEADFLKDERRRQAIIQDFTKAYVMGQNGQWDSAQRLLENRHENIVKLGGDPRDTAGLLQMVADPNRREEALAELGGFYAAGVASGDIAPIGGQQGMASAKTRQFVDGTVQMVLPDGSVQVVLPNGQKVAGDQAQAALQAAMANEVNYAGQKSGAMASAQQGAQFQYAAPIAGAQAQARANVEAATAPVIAASVTKAENTAKADVERETAQRGNAVAFDAYNQAMGNIRGAFGQTDTGPIAGRMPAVTVGQQTAEGAISAAAPVLKQLFRSAGEGVFTDKDQQLLIDMLPKRTDHPEVVTSKLGMIDSVVAAKLNMGGPQAETLKGPVNVPQGTSQKNPMEGKRAVNPQTGETIIMRNGQWVPL